jgi:cell division protein FtsB
MALLDFLPGGNVGWLVLIGTILALIVWWTRLSRKHIERAEISKSGPTAKKLEAELEAEEAEEKHIEAAEEAVETRLPKGAEGKAAHKVEKAAEKTEELEQATTREQEDALAIISDLRNTTTAIHNNTTDKIAIETAGEREIASLKSFETKIGFLNNHNNIDAEAKKFLKTTLEGLASHLEKQAEFERQAIEHQQKFCDNLRESTQHLKPISSEAKKHLKTIDNREKKEKKGFDKELKGIKTAIRDKIKQLNKEKRKGENADLSLIAELRKEIIMFKKNKDQLSFLQDQINRSNELIELELSKLKQLIQRVIRIAKAQKKEVRKIKKREKALHKKGGKLKDRSEKIKKSIENFSEEGTSHGMALTFSRYTNEYFTYYLEELNDDLGFEQLVKVFASDNLIALEIMNSFTKLLASIVKSEEALEGAIQASVTIIQVIMTEDISGSLPKQAEALKRHIAVLDRETDIDKKMAALDQQTIKESMAEIRLLNQLIEKYKKIIAETEALHKSESQHLGSSMGKMMKRKVAIDENYMQQATRFGEQLEKRNAAAAAAYQQAK